MKRSVGRHMGMIRLIGGGFSFPRVLLPMWIPLRGRPGRGLRVEVSRQNFHFLMEQR